MLKYRCSGGESGSQDVAELVPLDWTPCNYGGKLAWFLCARVEKGGCYNRPVAQLYFISRNCHGLAYESQRVSVAVWHLRRVQKLGARLIGSAN